MIKEIKLNIKIGYSNGTVAKHNWLITGFMFRRLKIIHNKKLSIRTATEIRDWFMQLLQGAVIK